MDRMAGAGFSRSRLFWFAWFAFHRDTRVVDIEGG